MSFAEKSPEMQNFLEEVFGTRTALEKGYCPLCKQMIGDFRDELSEREYNISGMCQSCQDDVFGAK